MYKLPLPKHKRLSSIRAFHDLLLGSKVFNMSPDFTDFVSEVKLTAPGYKPASSNSKNGGGQQRAKEDGILIVNNFAIMNNGCY